VAIFSFIKLKIFSATDKTFDSVSCIFSVRSAATAVGVFTDVFATKSNTVVSR
jgi:hypothetical protein